MNGQLPPPEKEGQESFSLQDLDVFASEDLLNKEPRQSWQAEGPGN